MSKSRKDYKVGYKRPPVGKPFGPGNQAARGRRKRRPGKSQVMEGLRDALLQEVQVQQKGKQHRVRLGYGIGHQIGQQLAQAALPVKVKVLADLKKHGLLQLFDDDVQLEDERAELELEKREFARRQKDAELLNDIIRDEAKRDRINLRCAYQMLSQLKESSDPGLFVGEFLQQYEDLREIVVSVEEVEALVASLSLRELFASGDEGSADDLSDDGDLREGMLGDD